MTRCVSDEMDKNMGRGKCRRGGSGSRVEERSEKKNVNRKQGSKEETEGELLQ